MRDARLMVERRESEGWIAPLELEARWGHPLVTFRLPKLSRRCSDLRVEDVVR